MLHNNSSINFKVIPLDAVHCEYRKNRLHILHMSSNHPLVCMISELFMSTQKYLKGNLLKFKLGFTEVLFLGKMIKPMCANYLVHYSSEVVG